MTLGAAFESPFEALFDFRQISIGLLFLGLFLTPLRQKYAT